MSEYRCGVTVKGSPSRPPYSGYVQVATNSTSREEIRACVVRKLQAGAFRDIWPDSVVINTVELLWE